MTKQRKKIITVAIRKYLMKKYRKEILYFLKYGGGKESKPVKEIKGINFKGIKKINITETLLKGNHQQ